MVEAEAHEAEIPAAQEGNGRRTTWATPLPLLPPAPTGTLRWRRARPTVEAGEGEGEAAAAASESDGAAAGAAAGAAPKPRPHEEHVMVYPDRKNIPHVWAKFENTACNKGCLSKQALTRWTVCWTWWRRAS